MMKKAIIFSTVILVLFLAGCQDGSNSSNGEGDSTRNGNSVEITEITQEICTEYGGSWNECGSPCQGTEAQVCVAMCAQQCECGGIAGFGCPPGWNCRLTGEIADELGVCVKA